MPFILCQSKSFHDRGTAVGDHSWSFYRVFLRASNVIVFDISFVRWFASHTHTNHKNFPLFDFSIGWAYCTVWWQQELLFVRNLEEMIVNVCTLNRSVVRRARTRKHSQAILLLLPIIRSSVSPFFLPHNKILAIKCSSHYSISKYSIVCACMWAGK